MKQLTEDEVFTIIMDTLLDFYNGDLETTGMRGSYRIAAQRIVAKLDQEERWVCVNGHDACSQMYASPDCPYCEKR
jgi:hypothetical protein